MRKTEIITGSLAIIGFILKLFDVVASDIILIVALGVLSNYYLFMGIFVANGISLKAMFKKQSYQGMSAQRMIGSFAFGFGASVVVLGVLFKILLIPGSGIMLIVGVQTIVLVSIIATIFYAKRKRSYLKKVFPRLIVFGVLGTAVFSIPKSTLIEIYYSEKMAEAYKASIENPNDEEAYKRLEEMRDSLKE